MTKILSPTLENINLIGEAIQSGEVVALPTETVYGLASDALNEKAVSQIFKLKQRPSFDPLIVHIGFQSFQPKTDNLENLEKQTNLINLKKIPKPIIPAIERLISSFWPGPLTIVFPKSKNVPEIVTSGLDTVGIRMPAHPIIQGVLNQTRCPLAAPSANRFGKISPTSAKAVVEELDGKIKWVLNGGICKKGLESTVIGIKSEKEFILLRPGAISVEEIRKTLNDFSKISLKLTQSDSKIQSPGQLSRHYSPGQECILLKTTIETALKNNNLKNEITEFEGKVGILFFKEPPVHVVKQLAELRSDGIYYRILSVRGDYSEAAKNLFLRLRELDQAPIKKIWFEPCPSEEGLGRAIQDRLKRAALKNK